MSRSPVLPRAPLTRRRFVQTLAAAGVAGPLLLRSPSPARAAANERLTLGMIGVGTMGRSHVGRFLGYPDVQIVAVADVVAERREHSQRTVEERYAKDQGQGTYRGCAIYRDFRELLAMPGLDAVLIATPDHWHVIPAILAARAKKDIYCEKPLTLTIGEGRRLVDEVRKADVVFQTGSQQRTEFGGQFRQAAELVRNGRIGKVRTVRVGVGAPPVPCDLAEQPVPKGTDWDLWLGPAPWRGYNEELCPKGVHKHFPAFRNYREYAGGGLADMGAHHFDIAQWAMGVDRSGPVAVIPPDDPKATRGLRFIYASGVEMIHNQFEKGKDGKEIHADCVFEGDKGMILVSRGGIRSLPDSILNDPIGPGEKHVYPSTSHHGNWLDCIKTGKETICPAEVGHRSATICHLGNIGYRLHRKLTWDPVKEVFTDDAKASAELTREPRAKWKL